jgi:pyridinium-3,5-biscarboxylic acid mononucleotide sulfurtransferase
MDWQDKLADIRQMIAKKENILIAYSGDVDSGFLASVAGDVLKEDALSFILDSEPLPRSELFHAEELARSLGLNFEVRKCSLLSLAEIRK